MPLRLLRPALLAALVLTLGVPAAAWAADAVLREPADAVVTGATGLVVRVATGTDERAGRIDATLRHVDGELAPDARHPLCEDVETCSRPRADYTIEFDPRTGAPFLPPGRAQILANGDYVVRLVVTPTEGTLSQTVDLPLTISAPGTAPADVAAAAEDGEVLLSWRPAPEPDVVGYLVERATGEGWVLVAEVPAEAVSITDEPGSGRHAYRVVTLRPDGRGATYETVSREATVDVPAPSDPPVSADDSDDATAAPPPDPDTGPSPEESAPAGPEATPSDAATGVPTPRAPQEGEGDDRSGPTPDPSLTARTVTEDGELLLGSRDAAPTATRESSAARLALPGLVAAGFVALAVRVWRRGRPVHRPPA